jgi:hypothetical protein
MLATLAFVCVFPARCFYKKMADISLQYAVSGYATLTDDAGQDNSGLQFAQTVSQMANWHRGSPYISL